MNMKRRVLIVGLTGMAFLLSTASVYAERGQGRGWDRGKGREEMHENMIKELNVTAEQQERLQTHRRQQMETKRQLHERLQSKHEELGRELEKEKTDTARVGAITNEIKTLTAQGIDQRVQAIQEVKGILTPEQFSLMNQKMEKFRREKQEKFKKEFSSPPEGAEE